MPLAGGLARPETHASDPTHVHCETALFLGMKTKTSGIRENQEEPTEVITVIAAVRIGDLA
jgi:hypothetical protein